MSALKLSWSEFLSAIGARQNERAGVTGVALDIPYSLSTNIETILREVSNMKLREVPIEELEALGSNAMTQADYTNGAAFPLTAIRVGGARIDGNPAVQVQPAAFYQNRYSAYSAIGVSYQAAIYMFAYGKVFFNGSVLTLSFVYEPTLADYQADKNILPAKYDQERIDLAHEVIEGTDYLPFGRL